MGYSVMLHKHSVTLGGSQTSVSLEDEFWLALRAIALRRGQNISTLIVNATKDRKPKTTRTSAIRVFVLKEYINGGRADQKHMAYTSAM